jgi:hypothetical protein
MDNRRAGEDSVEAESDVIDPNLQKLQMSRDGLLRLHKILLNYQQRLYERERGKIANSYELLQLVLHDSDFAWLHYLSELVVQIDERLAGEEKPADEDVSALLDQARFLVIPAEEGDDFQRRYFEALQKSPDVVLAHSEVVKQLGKRSSDVH